MRRRRPALRIVRHEPADIAGKLPPHDIDAEAAVISAVLINAETFAKAQEVLGGSAKFYSDPHKIIWEAIEALDAEKAPIDIVSVASVMREGKRLAEAGGPSYLAQLIDATPSVVHVETHAWIVHKYWRRRQAIALGQRIAAEGHGEVESVQEWLEDVEQDVYRLTHIAKPAQGATIKNVVQGALTVIQESGTRGNGVTGIPTLYEKLDAKTGGLHRGDVVVVAGRPGMGKTSLALNIGVNVAAGWNWTAPNGQLFAESGSGVVVVSLEMPREQLGARMLCTEARVDLGRARCGYMQPDDEKRLTDASVFLAELPLWVEDRRSLPAPTMGAIRGRVKRIQSEYDREAPAKSPGSSVGLLIIDYISFIKPNEGAESREQAVAEISREAKELAQDLNVAVILLAQLNRDVERRPLKDRRPTLADLRESGAIEQDADTIVFIYRDEYYNPKTDAKGIAELIIAKQRNGPTGKVLTRFSASCTRFDNLAAGDYPEVMEDE